MGRYGHFDGRAYVVTDPSPPRPWINYLGNRRLRAFVSQNAGGLLWHREPFSRRITRYHYTAAPGDRPGFYLYLRDRDSGEVWNPHFAPACAPLDRFACRHRPGATVFEAARGGVEARVAYGIPPDDDVLLWRVTLRNAGGRPVSLQAVSYLEFGLLEFLREAVGWCYLKNQFSLRFDAALNAIRYDYHVFEAPFAPRMLFGCTDPVDGWACSRDAFIGATGTYAAPAALGRGRDLPDADLPLGGHACAVEAVDVRLDPGAERTFGFVFALGDDPPAAEAVLARYRTAASLDAGFERIDAFWERRLSRLQVRTGDEPFDRAVNTWIPYNSLVALDLARTISTDHMGTDGLRYRDTAQDALAAAAIDPDFAERRLLQVLARQRSDGAGCMAFFPDDPRPATERPRRSDNTVWPVYTAFQLVAETGDPGLLERPVPFRDGGEAGVLEHLARGLRHIERHRGPHGLPLLFHADWNDGLALFGDERAESVMLGMQLVYACKLLGGLAGRAGDAELVSWCGRLAGELTERLNDDAVWDGRWYRRLLLSSGKTLGSAANRQGQIFLTPQCWSVLSGVGDAGGRGRAAMDAVAEQLDTACGLRILAPPFTGIPEPEDPPLGSHPGVGENGGIFCHANAWAVIAEALLGRAERAYGYFRAILPEVVSERVGPEHYEREPYVFVSSIVGPGSERFGQGGISWLTGTASWMHVAATQYLLGIRPTLDGLTVTPCLPAAIERVEATRRFRGARYVIEIDNRSGRATCRRQPASGEA